jgi:hypothetical protein
MFDIPSYWIARFLLFRRRCCKTHTFAPGRGQRASIQSTAERGLIRTEERPSETLDKLTGLGDRIVEIGDPDQALVNTYANPLRRGDDRMMAAVRHTAHPRWK